MGELLSSVPRVGIERAVRELEQMRVALQGRLAVLEAALGDDVDPTTRTSAWLQSHSVDLADAKSKLHGIRQREKRLDLGKTKSAEFEQPLLRMNGRFLVVSLEIHMVECSTAALRETIRVASKTAGVDAEVLARARQCLVRLETQDIIISAMAGVDIPDLWNAICAGERTGADPTLLTTARETLDNLARDAAADVFQALKSRELSALRCAVCMLMFTGAVRQSELASALTVRDDDVSAEESEGAWLEAVENAGAVQSITIVLHERKPATIENAVSALRILAAARASEDRQSMLPLEPYWDHGVAAVVPFLSSPETSVQEDTVATLQSLVLMGEDSARRVLSGLLAADGALENIELLAAGGKSPLLKSLATQLLANIRQYS